MLAESYAELVQSFDWATVHEALGWKPGEKVSLGASIVDRHADSGRVALISIGAEGAERRFTYRHLAEASNRFANLLRRIGVQPGDRVAGLMPRGPEVVVAIIGTLKLGAIYVPIFTGFGPDAIRFRLDHCRAKVLVTHHEATAQLPAGMTARIICVSQPGTKLPTGYLDFYAEIEREAADFSCVLRDRDDAAALIYTSGSTGQPKGGTIAVNFLAAVWPYIVYGLDLRARRYVLAYRRSRLGLRLRLLSRCAGGRWDSDFSPAEPDGGTVSRHIANLWRNQSRHDADAATQRVGRWTKKHYALPIFGLRALSSCGEPLNAKVVESFQRVWNITPMDHFGATEYALPIGNFNAIPMTVKPGSMGLPFPGFHMAIVGEDGNELPAEKVGFIGKRVDANCRYWTSYWDDPAATSKLVRNGWIVTGDLGRRDARRLFLVRGPRRRHDQKRRLSHWPL